MMYAHATPHKVSMFAVFMVSLAIVLAATMVVKKDMPAEYFSVDGLVGIGSLSVTSFGHRISLAQENNLSLASVGEAFGLSQAPLNSNEIPARDIPVLVYHGITDIPGRFNSTSESFKEQMFALKQAGYRTITLKEFESFVRGKSAPQGKVFLLTFDDGRSDSYYGADPILQALGFNAVMFISTKSALEGDNTLYSYYLQKGMLERMIRSGRWEIGSHAIQETGGFVPIDAIGTESNFLSNRMWLATENRNETEEEYRARVYREMTISKQKLKTDLDVDAYAFSYPFGDYGNQSTNYPNAETVIREAVRDTYDLAFQQVWSGDVLPASNYPGEDMIRVRRIEPIPNWPSEYLLDVLSDARAKNIPYNDMFSSDNGWRTTWGASMVHEEQLLIQSTSQTTGAFVFLDGTHDWSDYMYTISGQWEKGSHVSLMGYIKDNDNHFSCTFSDGAVKIEQKINGVTHILVNVPNEIMLPMPDVTLGMSVNDTAIRCFEGSRVATYTFKHDTRLDKGAIGIKIWDVEPGNASFRVTSLTAVRSEEAEALVEKLPRYDIRR